MRKLIGVRPVAALLLAGYGILVLAAALPGMRDPGAPALAQSWAGVLFVVVLGLAVGVSRGESWALWGTVLLTVSALIALPPLAFAVLGPSAREALGARLSLALIFAELVLLAAVISLGVRLRRATRPA